MFGHLTTSLVPGSAWLGLACLCAGVVGFLAAVAMPERIQHSRAQRKRRKRIVSSSQAREDLPSRVLAFIDEQGRERRQDSNHGVLTKGFWGIGRSRFNDLKSKVGPSFVLVEDGYCRSRAYFSGAGLGVGALVGVTISNELMVVLGAVCFCVGWRLPLWALKQTVSRRTHDLERHLSEMLEVVSLGLRSGLSFDRSFELYHRHFDTALGRESAQAQKCWELGLKTREEALKALAATYDSALFGRVIDNVVRSIRFGSSLAESFESSAFEARVIHKASRQEEVAKAPIKMLIPTAALILPAMLLLVLGPILLEMMQGF